MSDLKRVGDLQIGVDMDFTRQMWRVQRAGWILMGLVILLALLGFFGGAGVLAHGVAGQREGPLWVEYDRYSRFQSPSKFVAHFQATPDEEGNVAVTVNRAFLRGFQVEQIAPQPEEVELAAGGEEAGATYKFRATGSGTYTITFHLQTEDIGRQAATISIPTGEQVQFNQFVFP